MADVLLNVDFPLVSRMRQTFPDRCEIRQFDYMHDMVVLDYLNESGSQNPFRDGSPVSVVWGPSSRPETYVGYVLYTKQRVQNGEHSLRVVCIAPSHRFKEAGHSVHRDVSLQQAIARTALDNQFEIAFGSVDHFAYESVAWTSGETAWQFFVRSAQRQGYSLFANRTTLFCYDPVEILLKDAASLPVLNYIYGTGGKRGELVSFTPQRSDEGVGRQMENREEVLLGVDPRSAQIVGVANDGTVLTKIADVSSRPLFQNFVKDTPIAGVADAQARLAGIRKSSRWVHSATAHAYGNVGLRQGRGVIISGVDAENDGSWYINGVTHILETHDRRGEWMYFSDLDLRRDSNGLSGAPLRGVRPIRSSVYSPPPNNTVLDGRMWRAAAPVVRAVSA